MKGVKYLDSALFAEGSHLRIIYIGRVKEDMSLPLCADRCRSFIDDMAVIVLRTNVGVGIFVSSIRLKGIDSICRSNMENLIH